jgi:hypothetical protein
MAEAAAFAAGAAASQVAGSAVTAASASASTSASTAASSSASTAEAEVPSPGSSIIYFILVTMCFLFFTLFSINSSKNIEAINSAKNNNIINFVYILFIIIGSYFLNIHNSRIICDQSIEWNYILLVTMLPWIIIFILLFFILKLFPGWITPFSNTVGYIFISILGVDQTLKELMAKTDDIKDDPNKNELVKAINTINNNKSKFINQIDIDLSNFENFIDELNKANIIGQVDANDPNIMKLYKLITIKHVIGTLVWYILAGILISSISYNYIIGISCEKSVDQIIRDYETANPAQ